MVDVEIIEFKTPSGAAKLIFLTNLEGEGYEEQSLTQVLTEYFSQWGLIFNVKLILEDDGDKKYIAFVRYYSALATASARRSNKGFIQSTLMPIFDKVDSTIPPTHPPLRIF